MQAFTRVDVQTVETQTWFPGIRCFCEELVFVPGPKAATEETDGFLLGMVYDAARHKSFLAVSFSATCEHLVDLVTVYTWEFVTYNHVPACCWAWFIGVMCYYKSFFAAPGQPGMRLSFTLN